MSLMDFEVINSLGKGSFGSVDKVLRIKDKQIYAIKKVQFSNLSSKEKECALNEIRLMASITSPYIIAYKEAFFDKNLLCIVMELAEGGDMLQKIESNKRKGVRFQEYELWRYAIQMSKGLKSLHDSKILHRDLKCANVFLHSDGTIKLGDFNVSKIAKKGVLCTQTGTPYYASPEVWKDLPYNFKSDIWSLGVIIYELCTLHPPFMANSMEQLYRKIVSGTIPSIPSTYSKELNALVKQCLNQNPEKRPSCDEILAMDSVEKKLTDTMRKKDMGQQINLIGTIRMSKNINILKRHLPKPSYSREDLIDREERLLLSQNSARVKSIEPLKLDKKVSNSPLYLNVNSKISKLVLPNKACKPVGLPIRTPSIQKVLKELISPIPSSRCKYRGAINSNEIGGQHQHIRNLAKYDFKSEERLHPLIENQNKVKLNYECMQHAQKVELGCKKGIRYKLDMAKPHLAQNGVNILSNHCNKVVCKLGSDILRKNNSEDGMLMHNISNEAALHLLM